MDSRQTWVMHVSCRANEVIRFQGYGAHVWKIACNHGLWWRHHFLLCAVEDVNTSSNHDDVKNFELESLYTKNDVWVMKNIPGSLISSKLIICLYAVQTCFA